MLNRARLWIRALVLRRRLEREMKEEMAEHLARSAERLMARGLSAEEARREALREFGNVTYLQEEARYARGTVWLDALAADLRFALRHFARTPGTTLTMFVVLAFGMSIGTLLFSFVHSYAVQPPPGIARADDLVRIRGSQSAGADGRGVRGFSEDELRAYRVLDGTFAAVAGWTDERAALDAGEEADRRGLDAKVTFVTEDYFRVLGARPVLGPGLAADAGDPASAGVAVIGFGTWDRLFGRRPEVIGATVAVNGVPVTIAGVAPERFGGVGAPAAFQLWMPLAARPLVMREPAGDFRAAARLRPGVGMDAATAAVRVVAARAAASGASEEGSTRGADSGAEIRALAPSSEVVPLLSANGDPNFDRDVRLLSLSVGFLGVLVLLITCTNVSALLTGLATARRQEIAVRLSLGAARPRLIRQLLTESALLAVAAGAAALAIVWLALDTVNRFPDLPMRLEITPSAAGFTFGAALAVGVAFGLSPALHATRRGLEGALRDSSSTLAASRGRLQRGLVVAQIAFTMPLVALLAAVLLFLLREYRPQTRTELADRVVLLTVRPTVPAPPSSPAEAEANQRMRAAMDRLAERLKAVPGVEAAAIDWMGAPPLGAYAVDPGDRVGGASRSRVELSAEAAGEGYFEAIGIPLVHGRGFARGDAVSGDLRDAEAPAVIGADLARALWGGADPVGRRLRAAADSAGGARTLVVVGVIDDPRAGRRKRGDSYRVFLPPDTTRAPMGMILRAARPAEPLLLSLREVAQAEAPGTAVRVRTVAQVEEVRRTYYRRITGGLSAAGGMALFLSAIGLYAVVAFSVGQRTREIAVRIAVGARARQIGRRFIADGLRLSAIGLVLGLPASLLGLRVLMGLDDDMPSVPLSSVTVVAALGVAVVATAAAWIPARRAASVDPAIALRSE